MAGKNADLSLGSWKQDMDVDDKPAWVDCALVCRPQWGFVVQLLSVAESLPTKSEATLGTL